MVNIFTQTINTDIGPITIYSDSDAIIKIKFEYCSVSNPSPLTSEAVNQFNQYFNGSLKHFNLPIKLNGTAFEIKVWNELKKIPYGEIRSYKQIAENIGNINACRAVGNANNKNMLPIVIPCHRVIGSNGKLIGYAGGLHIKQKLLTLEQKYKKG